MVSLFLLYTVGEIGRLLYSGRWYYQFLKEFPLNDAQGLLKICYWFFALDFIAFQMANWLFCF
jgi:hypothetical protein